MRVRANSQYIFYPNMLDRVDGRTELVPGDIVTVVNLNGCPKANVMNHCYVEYRGQFMGMIHSNSLYAMSDRRLVMDRIMEDMKKLQEVQ